MKFAEIIAQDELKKHIRSAIRAGQVSHAYLIAGEKESGKRTIAEAFAETLLCDEREKTGGDDACGECKSCRQFESGNNPDFIRVTHEKPNLITIHEIREQVVNTVDLRPYSHAHKVYLIDDADKMNVQAQNALLKTIEEPPPYVVLILLAANTNAFLPTILSRCVKLTVKPVPEDVIERYLMRECGVPDYHAKVSAAFSQGNLGKAKSLATSEEFQEKKAFLVRLAKKLADAPEYELSRDAREIAGEKDAIDEFLDLLQIWYRDVLLYKATGADDGMIFREESRAVARMADTAGFRALNLAFQRIDDARAALRANVTAELVLERLLSLLAGDLRG